jgi:hypothetical protein
MLRLARLLAAIPADLIGLAPRRGRRTDHWRHGFPHCEQSRDHTVLALRAYHRTLEPG